MVWSPTATRNLAQGHAEAKRRRDPGWVGDGDDREAVAEGSVPSYTHLMKKHIKKIALALTVLVVLGMAALFGRFGGVSACHHCGALKYETRWEVPFMCQWCYFYQEHLEETPLSRCLSTDPAIASRPHQWIFIHGGGNGIKCALGSGGPVFSVACDPHMAQEAEASQQYADPEFHRQLVHAMLCPESAQLMGMAGYEMPEGGITSREAFLAWRKEGQENLAEAFEAAQKTAWDEPLLAAPEVAPPPTPPPTCEACTPDPSPACALAADLLSTLDPKQKPKAQLAWDSPDRTHWHFLPKAFRKGLPLAEMTPEQQRKVWTLLGSVLSPDALAQAKMTLDREAKQAQLDKNTMYDPTRYFLTVFGDPSGQKPWGFSFEGHHLSLNFSFDKAQLVSATPMFFGANPATVEEDVKAQVPRATLYRDEDLRLLNFYDTLNSEQQAKAQMPAKVAQQASDGGGAEAKLPAQPVGLCAADMTPAQRTALLLLVKAQVNKAQADFAKQVMASVEKEDPAKQFFGWHGEAKAGEMHMCLIQTGEVMVFVDAQAGHGPPKANHLHTMWRRAGKDF